MPKAFSGEVFTFHNPDGSQFEVRGWGNQFAAVFETLDGYTVVKHPQSGYYHYATMSEDLAVLVPNGPRVGQADPGTLGLPQHVRPPRASLRAQAEQARDEAGIVPRWEQRRAERRARQRASSEADAEAEEGPQAAGTTGAYKGLCLLVQFPDVAGTLTRTQVDDFCNKQGYSEFNNNGSVCDYFYSVSDQKLQYTNIVTAYYTTQNNRAYYTDPQVSFGTRARELIVEALTHLKTNGFDFSPLSSDSDGFVYALNIFYAGSRINNWSEGLWPHSWALASPFVASATKKFFDYQITDMGSQLTLGTFCHENGHMVCDYPDLYDYGYESNGVGDYSLMCFGGPETNPTQVDAYLKYTAGWASKVTTLTAGMTATVAAGKNDFLLHRKNANEYFIVENRQRSGRDAGLPDAGLAIWHVDQLGSNNNEQMTADLHYELSLEQADNRFDLERRVNVGDVEDLYGGSTAPKFGDTTAPNSKWWDGTASGLDIIDITEPGATITIKTKGAVSDMTSVVGTWQVVGVDWGCKGTVVKAGPFTFNANGTWSYSFGGGRWVQVGGTVFWNFTNAAGLVYAANINANAMSGAMGYTTAGGQSGCFYALRSQPPAAPQDLAHAIVQLLGGGVQGGGAPDGATGASTAGNDDVDPVVSPT